MAALRSSKSFIVTDFVAYVFVKFIFLFYYNNFLQSAFQEFGWFGQIFRAINNFAHGIVSSWIFGGMYSEIKLISWITIVAYFFIVFAICLKKDDWLDAVKKSIWLIFGLSMFTIWIEPWMTVSGYVQWFLGSLAFGVGVFLTIVDIIVSCIHYALTLMLINSIEQEFNNWYNSSQPAPLIEKKDRKNFLIVLLLHFFTLNIGSYFYLGQRQKGIAMAIYMIILLSSGIFASIWLVFFMYSLIDVYRIMYKVNRGQEVSIWSAQLNLYTFSASMMVWFMLIK
jgi:hypothetical protein